MKKLNIVVLLILITIGSAQAQLRFGLKAGTNASIPFNLSSVADELSPAFNFQIGGIMQYDFWIFSLQPELNLVRKTILINNAYDKYYLQQYAALTQDAPVLNYQSTHIELPVNLLYKMNVGKTKIFAEMGPFVSINLSGKFNDFSDLYKNYDNHMPFKLFDYGLGAGAGLEYKKFQLNAKWNWGLNWIGSKVPNLNGTGNINEFNDIKYRSLSISLGYFF
ncbi:MAG TPA: porin family protein [Bacteroidales bacterium]|nr:porin family protein [Bacteroidales bacterium]